jgi:TRAP-type C4-dicarboxylate transport system permease small subunit
MNVAPEHAGDPVVHAVDEDEFSPRETWLEVVTRWVIQAAVLLLVVMMGVEMIVRSLFGWSLQVTNELGGYALIIITFFGLSSGQAGHAFHRMHLLDDHLSPAGRALLRLLFDSATAVVALLLFVEFTRFTWITWRSGDVAATVLLTPLWLPRLAMPIGAFALSLTLLRTIVGDWRRLRRTRARPTEVAP